MIKNIFFLQNEYMFKGLVTHNDILKIYTIIQYLKNIFRCNMVKNIFRIMKNDHIFTQKIFFLYMNKIKPVWFYSLSEIIFFE